MNYTQNHHLPQWVKSDRIMMDDFNQMCRDIESGLNSAASKADSAQSAASSALSKANTPLYAVGTYTGNGDSSQSITTGFRPRFLIIGGIRETSGAGNGGEFSDYCCITGGHTISKHVVFNDSGFTVIKGPEGVGIRPMLNYIGMVYDYIAFR